MKEARANGFYTKILPGISAEDCLLADLLVNPGSKGIHSYEATDFLIHKRMVDPTGHLVLWQVGIIGVLTYPRNHCNKQNASILLNYLVQFYDKTHTVILYEAAQYPHFEAYIQEIPLYRLPEATFSPLTTLYIPPSKNADLDVTMLSKLNLSIEDLKQGH